jgi:hypothetical protein
MMAFLAKPLIKWGIIAAVAAALVATVVIQSLRLDNAKLERQNALDDLAQAEDINRGLAEDIRNLVILRQMDAKATAEELKRTEDRNVSVEKLKREMRNAEGANELAGPYFDDLGDRLRNLDAGPDQKPD